MRKPSKSLKQFDSNKTEWAIIENVSPIVRVSCLAFLLAAASSLSGCFTPSCDTAMRYSTISVDFSSLPGAGEGLEFEIGCPGKSECSDRTAGVRFDAVTENDVAVYPEVPAVDVVVYEKGSRSALYERTLDPVPWDPPIKPNTCPTPAKAVLVL